MVDLTVVQDAGFAITRCQLKARWRATAGPGLWPVKQMMFDPQRCHQRWFSFESQFWSPNIKSVIVEVPAKDTLYGARGVGEPPIVATATAIANAVADAIGSACHGTAAHPGTRAGGGASEEGMRE